MACCSAAWSSPWRPRITRRASSSSSASEPTRSSWRWRWVTSAAPAALAVASAACNRCLPCSRASRSRRSSSAVSSSSRCSRLPRPMAPDKSAAGGVAGFSSACRSVRGCSSRWLAQAPARLMASVLAEPSMQAIMVCMAISPVSVRPAAGRWHRVYRVRRSGRRWWRWRRSCRSPPPPPLRGGT